MKYVETMGLTKSYGSGDARVVALDDISFTLDYGEFAAVMGPSGSGKSTLLSILGAMNTPSAGKYMVDNRDVYALSSDDRADFRRKYLGFVFQNFHLVPYLTLLENVMVPLSITRAGASKKREWAGQALARVGLADKGHRLPNQVSGGEQERASIARALVNRPPILLADEPTGNLDWAHGFRGHGTVPAPER